ncbi:MAG: host attachment protein [Alphaproteobacteria bacterium]|nr:host attachment protein [Alphaproteobacteria bacterium]
MQIKRPIAWVLVADGRRARVFEVAGKGKFALRDSFETESPPNRDIVSDRPGRAFDRAGPGRHAMAPASDPHENAKKAFLHDVAERLDSACYEKQFEKLVVVAPPPALGELRSIFPKRLRAAVTREVPKDLSGLDDISIAGHLQKLEVL